MAATPITDSDKLTPGDWYCVGFENEEGEIVWDYAPVYRYIGNGQWEDEEGQGIDTFFDPLLQLAVATNAADAYLPQ